MGRSRPAGAADHAPSPGPAVALPVRWPLVGRDDHLHEVTEALLGPQAAVVVAGSAGIGKTRLVQEALEVMATKGYATEWAMASAEARTITFGALAPWLSKTTTPDGMQPLDVARALRNDLLERHGHRVVLVVDDAHLLDGPSAVLIQQLAATRSAVLLLTVRTGMVAPGPVRSLWKDDIATRVDLSPLSAPETDQLLSTALGDPIESTMAYRLWQESDGNPLWLRELVLDGIRSGRIRRVGGRWSLRAGPSGGAGPRLSELIDVRLDALGPDQLAHLEAVALGEPLPLALAQALVPPEALAALNQADLLRLDQDDRHPTVLLGHPLYGEVIRSRLSPLRAAELWRKLVAALESATPADDTDLRRQVLWRLEAGLPVSSKLLERAATVAWRQFDPDQAERFASAAVADGQESARVVLVEALATLGKWKEIAAVAANIDMATLSIDDQCRLLRLRMWQGLFSGKTALADELMAEVEALATDTGLRYSARAMRAAIALFAGQTEQAEAMAVDVLRRDSLTEQARRLASSAATTAGAYSGHSDQAIEIARRELATMGIDETYAFAPHQLMWGYAFGLWRSGRYAEAEIAVPAYYQSSLNLRDPSLTPIALAVLGVHHCQIGRLDDACRILGEAVDGLGQIDPLHYLAIIAAYLAIVRASAGDGPGADEALAVVEEAPVHYALYAPTIARARAWTTACGGDLASAATQAMAAADTARRAGQFRVEVEVLHDVVRMGAGAQVNDALRAAAEQCEGPLAALCADHSQAQVEGDASRLEAVADRFRTLGARLLAAEVFIEAGVRFREGGLAGRSQRCAAAAEMLLEGDHVATPAVRLPLELERLTPREIEIAILARDGMADAAIAERLGLSVRTVGNHLYNAYAKLGVTRRSDLRGALTRPW